MPTRVDMQCIGCHGHLEHRLLVALKPVVQGNYEEPNGLYDMVHCANRLSLIYHYKNIIWLV